MTQRPIRAIRTDADYRAALVEIERYFEKEPKAGTRAARRFDQLTLVLEHYESRHWPIRKRLSPRPVAGPLRKG